MNCYYFMFASILSCSSVFNKLLSLLMILLLLMGLLVWVWWWLDVLFWS